LVIYKGREFVCPFAFSGPIYDIEELKESIAIETLVAVLKCVIILIFILLLHTQETKMKCIYSK